MCLTINIGEKNRPYREDNVRYKIVRKINTCGVEQLQAPFKYTDYKPKDWNVLTLGSYYNPSSHGFHVFVNRQGAIAAMKSNFPNDSYSVEKIEVLGFLARGTWENKPSETWAAFRFVK